MPRVLIVDDEQSILEVFDSLLSEHPEWEYECVDAAAAAIESFRGGRFDVVVLDKNMPTMTGVEVAKAIRELDADVSLIMLTGFGTTDSAVEMLELRASNYIEKPPDFIQMVSTLELAAAQCAERRRARAAGMPSGSSRAPGAATVFAVCSSAQDSDWYRAELSAHNVVSHHDATSALAGLETVLPNLILVDLNADLSKAQALIHELAAEVIGLEYLVLADRLSLAVVKDLIEHGVLAIVTKPVSGEELALRVARLVER